MATDRKDPRYPDGCPREAQPKWRRDFPVEVAEDEYVSRRDFAKFLILTSGAFLVGQGWVAGKAAFAAPGEGVEDIPIAPLDEIPVGGVVRFSYPGENDACLLVRPDAGTLVAFDQRCTHLSCAVLPDMESGRFVCPCHKGYFDLKTGGVLSGPPQRPLVRIRLDVRDGIVHATGVERRT